VDLVEERDCAERFVRNADEIFSRLLTTTT
jgi:hypothetical protein